MEQSKLRQLVFQGLDEFGVKCKKFSGALTVEILRCALKDYGIPVSSRDVFIRGISVELDLIVPKTRSPKYGLVYEPEDVLAALEVKELGSWGAQTLNQIKRNFELIQLIKGDIYCAYITLSERRGFKQAITTESLGFPAYTLFWWKGNDVKDAEPSGDYQRFLDDLRKICSKDSDYA